MHLPVGKASHTALEGNSEKFASRSAQNGTNPFKMKPLSSCAETHVCEGVSVGMKIPDAGGWFPGGTGSLCLRRGLSPPPPPGEEMR